jgi:predicted acylesterase/phospholipase RssA
MSAQDPIDTARDVLSGVPSTPEELLSLAKQLKGLREFGLARRILARARNAPGIFKHPKFLEIFQQSALCTYKDPTLPADSRLDRALEILEMAEDLATTTTPETLGIAGGIYKRKWEVDNQKSNLERSLFYYRRGYKISSATGQRADQGYNGINAAYLLDLLAHQEEKEADGANALDAGGGRELVAARRAEARAVREEIAEKVAPLVDEQEGDWLQGKWWFYSTVAEAYFGLGTKTDPLTGEVSYDQKSYDKAVWWLERGMGAAELYDWEYESTARQLAALARLQAAVGASGEGGHIQGKPPWEALKSFLKGRTAPLQSAFAGKVGLGLSGGGFRASLFHIGVLAKLAELDVLRRVEVFSCVSGGSIIGAHYYLEVRKLLQERADDEIGRDDYVRIVKKVARDFLEGVQRNVRTRVATNPLKNLKMIFVPAYSRTTRAGDLYESQIFSRVEDGGGHKERWLDELEVHPLVEGGDGRRYNDKGFSPSSGNWFRENKAPVLILNAATLNTGHTWHFTTSYMGEPPAGIDSQIDGNDRFRRMSYADAPEGLRKVRLGHAVGASACVQGVFEPLALEGLYPDRVVRLVDGGTCDNQGVGGLLEQDCNVLLISDGSGQMESVNDPSNGLLGVPLRSTTILQARIRQAQYQDLCARHRSRLLRGLMFVHLKNDLDVDPVDWVDCPDPYSADDEMARRPERKGNLTRYGIDRKIQQSLAGIRTDLDSFSDVEAFALMTSGYRQTEYAFEKGNCVEGFRKPEGARGEDFGWEFLAVEKGLKGVGRPHRHVKRLLDVSGTLAFKILKLDKAALALALLLAVVGLAVLTALVIVAVKTIKYLYARPFLSAVTAAVTNTAASVRDTFTEWPDSLSKLLMVGAAILAVAAAGIFISHKKSRGETLVRVVLSFAGVITSIIAWVHLLVFDRWFLSEGSIAKFNALAEQHPEQSAVAGAHREVAHEATRSSDILPPPGGGRPALAESHARDVAPAVEVVGGMQGAAAVDLLGNGHSAKPESEGTHPQVGGDADDPDARQN